MGSPPAKWWVPRVPRAWAGLGPGGDRRNFGFTAFFSAEGPVKVPAGWRELAGAGHGGPEGDSSQSLLGAGVPAYSLTVPGQTQIRFKVLAARGERVSSSFLVPGGPCILQLVTSSHTTPPSCSSPPSSFGVQLVVITRVHLDHPGYSPSPRP